MPYYTYYLLLIYHFFAGASEGLPLIFLSFILTGSVIVLHSLIYPVTLPNTSFKIAEKQCTYQDISIALTEESSKSSEQPDSHLDGTTGNIPAKCRQTSYRFPICFMHQIPSSLPVAWSGWTDLSRNPVTWIDVLSVLGSSNMTFFSIPKSWGTKWGLFKQSQNKGDNCFWKHLYQISLYIYISYLFNQLHVIVGKDQLSCLQRPKSCRSALSVHTGCSDKNMTSDIPSIFDWLDVVT